MKFKVMDILNMKEFKENIFQIVIDKGALDLYYVEENLKKIMKNHYLKYIEYYVLMENIL